MMRFKDEHRLAEPSGIRKGRFLCLDDQSRTSYVDNLQKRIRSGFFTSDMIISKIVEDIAPIFNENLERDLSLH